MFKVFAKNGKVTHFFSFLPFFSSFVLHSNPFPFPASASQMTASMIGTLVRALGKNPLQKEVDGWIAELGGADASIDVSTVKKYYNQKLPKPRDQERDMREAFKVLDIQGKGFINEAELRQIMCTLGEPLTQEEFNLLMTKCQKDDDGTIMYDQASIHCYIFLW